jgi:hypothetical protein
MSDLAFFAVGIGIGLLVVMPVIYVLRHEIAANARKLFGSSAMEEGSGGPIEAEAGSSRRPGGGHPEGISPVASTIGAGAAVLVLLWGVVSGNAIFAVSGAVVAVGVLLARLVRSA